MSTWSKHGEYQKTELLAGILPRRGVNYICGPHDAGKTAILADLVVALAAGDLGCGLGHVSSGARKSLNGWFGHAVGAPSRIAVVSPIETSEALRAAIEANALARGATAQLPIVLCSQSHQLVAALQGGMYRWHEAKEALGGLDLIVIADATFGEPHEHRKLVLALSSVTNSTSCSVLVSVGELPSSQAACAEVILETSSDSAGGVLALAKATTGAGWSRRFELWAGEIRHHGGVCRNPGRVVAFAPKYVEAAPAPEPVPEPELPIVARVVYPKCGFDISDTERARWPDHGWISSPREAIAVVEGNMRSGRTEIVIAFDERGGFAQPEINRIETALLSAHLERFAIVTASEQRLLPPW